MDPRQGPEGSFAADATAVLDRLATAIAGVIASLPGEVSQRPVDLANALEIDLKLAWRVFRLSQARDPIEATRHVPGANGFRIWLESAASVGASPTACAASAAAYTRLQEFIAAHAGSRRDFDLMVAAVAGRGDGRLELEHRRQLFSGASSAFGVRCRVQFRIDLIAPSKEPERFDTLAIRGFAGLQRLRPGMLWQIEETGVVDGGNHFVPPQAAASLGNGIPRDRDRPPLIEAFCSQPIPRFERVSRPGQRGEFRLVEGSVGRTSEITLVAGELLAGVGFRVRRPGCSGIHSAMQLRTPAELAIFDLWLHEELADPEHRLEQVLYGDLYRSLGVAGHAYLQSDRLPSAAEPEMLGLGIERSGLRELEWYESLIRFAFTQAGWDPQRFLHHRSTTPFPPTPATLLLEQPVPEP
jgi:hypothetical protein